MGYTRDCEPLRVWNRLEPRARQDDFSQVLRAEIHDPLWLLARQWQFGELRGEDTGSPISARIAMRTARIAAFHNRGPASAVPDSVPLEARVEREAVPVDVVRRAQLGRQWLAILDHHGALFNASGAPGPRYDAAAARARALAQLAIRDPGDPPSTAGAVLAQARRDSNPRARSCEVALIGRAVDGVAVIAAIPPGPIVWAALGSALTAGVAVEHRALVIDALSAFRTWIAGVWSEPESDADTAWNPAQLEYQFSCDVPRPDGSRVALRADEYASGRLDWYAFDLAASAAPPGDTAGITETTLSVIPTLAEYPGQPNPRFWQLEDGAVDLGNVRADTTDLAKLLLAQFALVYGNNWFVVPCQQPVGSLAEVLGIVIVDVFGQRSLVKPANRAGNAAWTRWDLFSLDGDAGVGAHLFLPPAVPATLESDELESVRLVRDEVTNTVWAVEVRIPDGVGGGRDGHDAARSLTAALQRQEPAAPPPAASQLRYALGNTVPENWIPFLPVHKPDDDRAIRLQRGSMPRFFQDTVWPVRPRTRILRPGLGDDDRQSEPYFVHEEEVPRGGVQVDVTMQRARWLHGATTVWCGRRTRPGRGLGSSGLRFDRLVDAR